jgi:hypothetical protein
VLPAGFHFPAGSYTWTVAPVIPGNGASRTGPPIIESTFLISARS